MRENKYSIVILISGFGATLQSILDAVSSGQAQYVVAAVISNRPDAAGLQRARRAHIASHLIPDSPSERDAALLTLLTTLKPDLIVLAGYMRILGPAVVTAWQDRIINIHPSLLPQYPGLKSYERALTDQVKEHGTSVHFVTEQLDDGPILCQVRLSIHPNETIASLQSRVKKLEQEIYPRVINWLSRGDMVLKEHQLYYQKQLLPLPGLIFTEESVNHAPW